MNEQSMALIDEESVAYRSRITNVEPQTCIGCWALAATQISAWQTLQCSGVKNKKDGAIVTLTMRSRDAYIIKPSTAAIMTAGAIGKYGYRQANCAVTGRVNISRNLK